MDSDKQVESKTDWRDCIYCGERFNMSIFNARSMCDACAKVLVDAYDMHDDAKIMNMILKSIGEV